MDNHLKKSENLIRNLVSSELGLKYNLSTKLEDIPEIPINNFLELKKSLSSGQAILRMAPLSIDGTTFEIIATPFEQSLFIIFTLSIYLIPISGIILAIIFSWHWLLLILIAPIILAMRLNKRVYLHALFNSAFSSEIVFSFLFTAGKITLELPEHGILSRIP